jgi:hypothetical protein
VLLGLSQKIMTIHLDFAPEKKENANMKHLMIMCTVMGLCGIASASFVVQPTGATTTSDWGGWAGIALTINGAGLASGSSLVTTGQPIPSVWPGHSIWWGDGTYLAVPSGNNAAPTLPTVVYDLGQIYPLEGMHFWNSNLSAVDLTGAGVKTAIVSISTDGTNFTDITLEGLDTDGTFYQADRTLKEYAYGGETYNFSVKARYIRLIVTSVWENVKQTTGIAEVRFIAASCPSADLTQDCFVNMADFVKFADEWQWNDCADPNWCQGADFDKSGNVEIEDLAKLGAQWLTGIKP